MTKFSLEDFDYVLPKENIAQYPLTNRDQSNLLVYDKFRTISHHKFYELPKLIPSGSMLLRNISKVIPVRFFMHKQTGGKVEILLLEPVSPSPNPQITLSAKNFCIWKALLRGRNLKNGAILQIKSNEELPFHLEANIIEKNSEYALVEFKWDNKTLTFSEIVEQMGRVPLPPYIARDDEEIDKYRYQTIYAYHPGSVASHTAGLHFSEEVINHLQKRSIQFAEITLHIGLGTFKPIQTPDIYQHKMHKEKFSVSLSELKKIHEFFQKRTPENLFVAVGTTSVRTLESLFWLSQQIYTQKSTMNNDFHIIEQYPWQTYSAKLNPEESIENLLNYMERNNLKLIQGETSLYITPDYKINFFDAIITNFHQPRSTLLLLIYSFVGNDWKRIYSEALSKNYRFLSYGDSSLLFNIKQVR